MDWFTCQDVIRGDYWCDLWGTIQNGILFANCEEIFKVIVFGEDQFIDCVVKKLLLSFLKFLQRPPSRYHIAYSCCIPNWCGLSSNLLLTYYLPLHFGAYPILPGPQGTLSAEKKILQLLSYVYFWLFVFQVNQPTEKEPKRSSTSWTSCCVTGWVHSGAETVLAFLGNIWGSGCTLFGPKVCLNESM